MLDVVAIKDGQFDGTADTIVGTEGSTLSRQPFAVDVCLDGILVEIELHIDEFVAHHIHVALQDDGLAVLHPFGGRFADNHVARLVHISVESVTLTPVLEVVNHLLFALRRTRNLVNLCKLLEYYSRF